jgi:hypothetical protein
VFRGKIGRVSRYSYVAIVALAAACAPPTASEPDARPASADAAQNQADARPPGADASVAYRHTIVIDGTNDFGADETFPTTSSGYSAFVSWDVNNVYIGFRGADIAVDAPDSATKWVLVYFDTDPGTGTGQTSGEQYNTQQPGFPSGFAAEHYYRWKSDDSFEDVRSWLSNSWQSTAASVNASVDGDFMEVAITRSDLGDPQSLGIVMLMLNEKNLGEWSYAGLYGDAFTDGYYDVSGAPIPIASYLQVDFGASRTPNDPANKKP